MATQVQWRRGTTAQIAAFTGAVGEIVVDTTSHQISVQDGVTAGGFYAAKASGQTFTNITITGSSNILSGVISAAAGSILSLTLSTATIVNPTFSGAMSGSLSGGTFTGGTTLSSAVLIGPVISTATIQGASTAPTQALNDNSTKLATTAFVLTQIQSSVSVNLPIAAAMGTTL